MTVLILHLSAISTGQESVSAHKQQKPAKGERHGVNITWQVEYTHLSKSYQRGKEWKQIDYTPGSNHVVRR